MSNKYKIIFSSEEEEKEFFDRMNGKITEERKKELHRAGEAMRKASKKYKIIIK